MPPLGDIETVLEPYIKAEIIIPSEFIGTFLYSNKFPVLHFALENCILSGNTNCIGQYCSAPQLFKMSPYSIPEFKVWSLNAF